MEGVEHGGDLLNGEGDVDELEVVFQVQCGATGGRRDQVAGRIGQGDTQAPAHFNEHVILVGREMNWRNPDQVIDVGDRGVLAAITVRLALTGGSRVGDTGGWGDLAPE